MSAAAEHGIKETIEVLRAMKSMAILVYKAQRAGGTTAEIGQRIAGLLISSPGYMADLKAAADGIGAVPAELGDLSMAEAFELVAAAGAMAKEASAEIGA